MTERNSLRNILWIVGVTTVILLVPLAAMQFSDQVNWNFTDFATIGVLLIGTGVLYELLVRKVKQAKHRAILATVLVLAVLLVWVDLAVGIFGTPFSGS